MWISSACTYCVVICLSRFQYTDLKGAQNNLNPEEHRPTRRWRNPIPRVWEFQDYSTEISYIRIVYWCAATIVSDASSAIM